MSEIFTPLACCILFGFYFTWKIVGAISLNTEELQRFHKSLWECQKSAEARHRSDWNERQAESQEKLHVDVDKILNPEAESTDTAYWQGLRAQRSKPISAVPSSQGETAAR
jgi:hypothetical protein